MADPDLFILLEDASVAIGRLDARLRRSPLREAWHVRAACKAAISLVAVDGVQVREADLVGMMMGARLPVSESYLGAGVALGWWRRAMGRIVLSEGTKRLLGMSVGRRQGAREAQDDFDLEDEFSPAARRALAKAGDAADPDAWADAGAKRALDAMRMEGRGLMALAAGIRSALATSRMPEWPARAWEMQGLLKEQAEDRLEAETSGMDEGAIAARRREVEDMLDSLNWEGPRALGEVHMAVADRLLETGMTGSRLTILTGATKRMALERRGDSRAVAGFLHVLTREAREGHALLDTLEQVAVRWAGTPVLSSDKRSSLPDILWAFMVLPVADAVWLEAALELSPRVVQKFIHRLAAEGLISHWAERRTEQVEGRDANVRLWVVDGFDVDLERNVRSVRAWKRAEQVEGRIFADMTERHRDVDTTVPMSEIFQRFDDQIGAIDVEFGRLWGE